MATFGNLLRDIPKKPKVAEREFQIVDLDDEDAEINPSDCQPFPLPTGSASQMDNIREPSRAKLVRTNPIA